jgi:hypothetical protein
VLVHLDHVAGPGKLLAARGAGASCGGFGFARDTTTFDIFNWVQVAANFDDMPLLQSAPNRPDYIDVWALWLHGVVCCLHVPRIIKNGNSQRSFFMVFIEGSVP